MSTIQMPPAQDLFNVLNQQYEKQYKELHEKHKCLGPMSNFFLMTVSNKHTPTSSQELTAKVAEIAGQLHELIVAGQQIKILANLLDQGTRRLNRSPLAKELTVAKNLTRINPNFSKQCTQLFRQNEKNVKKLIDFQGKVNVLEESFQKNLNELLPAWDLFARTYGPKPHNRLSGSSDSNNSKVAANSEAPVANVSFGISNVATSAISNLTSGIFGMFYGTPQPGYNPQSFLDPQKVKPIPSLQDLGEFFISHRPQKLTENVVESDEVETDVSKKITCEMIYQQLRTLYAANFESFQKICDKASVLITELDLAITDADKNTGNSETLKSVGCELHKKLEEFGNEGAQHKVSLKTIQTLEQFLKIGVEYLTLPAISAQDQETIEILQGNLWNTISQAQKQEEEQLKTLKEDLLNLTKLKEIMEDHCGKIERYYHHHRYQVDNLSAGNVASLGPKQMWKKDGTFISNPTDSKMPKPLYQTEALKSFDSNEMELLLSLDPVSCLTAVVNRVLISPPNDESEKKHRSETQSTGTDALTGDQDAGDSVVELTPDSSLAESLQGAVISITTVDKPMDPDSASVVGEDEAQGSSDFSVCGKSDQESKKYDIGDLSALATTPPIDLSVGFGAVEGQVTSTAAPMDIELEDPLPAKTSLASTAGSETSSSSASSSLRQRPTIASQSREGKGERKEGKGERKEGKGSGKDASQSTLPAGQTVVTMSHSLASVATIPKSNGKKSKKMDD